MPERTASLLDRLRQSQLLEPGQLEELALHPEAGGADPRGLAREVVRRGWLTRFQINLVAQGRARDLAVGPYVLLDKLGEGGMGQVYKARHQYMSRVVALKVIRKEKLQNPAAVERFYQEVEAASQLHHPNIVIAFDANSAGDSHFLAMEYVEGTDLSRLVKESGPLPVVLACDYIRQAAEGLQHAFERGLVHRDVKPANLLLARNPDGSGTVKILDMGLARPGGAGGAGDRAPGGLTQFGQVLGTPDYLAPEQALDARRADVRSDLYGLGCTLFFLLAGRAPFSADSLAQLLLAHQREAAPPLSRFRPDAPAALDAVVSRLLAKRPEDRYQTPAELAEALQPFCRQQGPVLPPPPRPAAAGEEWATLALDAPAPAGRAGKSGGGSEGTVELPGRGRGRGKKASARSRNRAALVAAAVALPLVLLALLGAVLYARRGGAEVAANRQPAPQPAAEVRPRPAEAVAPAVPPAPARQEAPPPKEPVQPPAEVPAPQAPPPAAAPAAPVVGEAPVAGRQILREPPRNFSGHVNGVTGVVVSPDERLLLSTSFSDSPRLYDLATGRELHRFAEQQIQKVAFAQGGKLALFGGKDGVVRVYDVKERKLLRRLEGHTGEVASMAPSADGRRLLTGSHDKTARWWDVDSGKELRVLRGHTDVVNCVALTADGKRALSGSSDRTARLWDLGKGTELTRCESHKTWILAVLLSADGRRGYSAGDDKVVIEWDLATGKELRRMAEQPTRIDCLAGSPDGRLVALGMEGSRVDLLDLSTGRVVQKVTGNLGYVICLAFSPTGRHLAAGGTSRLTNLWEIAPADAGGQAAPAKPGEAESREPFAGAGVVRAVAWSGDGKRLLSGGAAGVRLWDAEQARELRRFPNGPAQATCVALSADGRTALAGGADGLWLWDVENPQMGLLNRLRTDAVLFLRAGRTAMQGGARGGIEEWDVATRKPAGGISDPNWGVVRCLARCPDENRILFVSDDGTVRVWDRAETKVVGKPLAAPRRVECLACSPVEDKRRPPRLRVVTGGGDRLARLYDLYSGRLLRSCKHGGVVLSVAFSPDGKQFLTGCDDGAVRLWNATTGQLVRHFRGHKGPVRAVVFSPDGRRAASGGDAIRVWELSKAAAKAP